jgi:ATP-dependent DNA helicase RecQ
MKTYASLPFGEHMGFLIKALDGDPSTATPPACPELPSAVQEDLVQDAINYLKGIGLPIEPRKKWSDFGMPIYKVKGFIPDGENGHQPELGKALCRYGYGIWGEMVKLGKYPEDKNKKGRFADDLVKACVEMIDKWNPQPRPAWVTCIPSLSHPELVPDFAKRLAVALELPLYMAIKKTHKTRPQKEMQNSQQQMLNLDGSLEPDLHEVLKTPGLLGRPVLLIDDMVDSRWTLTVAAWLLRSKGSGKVWPMALADAGRADE